LPRNKLKNLDSPRCLEFLVNLYQFCQLW